MKRLLRVSLLVAVLAATAVPRAPAESIPVKISLWRDANGKCPLWCEWPQLCPCIFTVDVPLIF